MSTSLRQLIRNLHWKSLEEYLETPEGKDELRNCDNTKENNSINKEGNVSLLPPLLMAVGLGCPVRVVEIFHQVDPFCYQRWREGSGLSSNALSAAITQQQTCRRRHQSGRTFAKQIASAFAIDPAGVCQRATRKERVRFPLHSICLLAPWETTLVLMILQAFPEAAKYQDMDGMFPLHLVLSNAENANHDKVFHPHVVSRLFEAYPDAIQTPDAQGNYPLHLACANPGIFLPMEKDTDSVGNRMDRPNLVRHLIRAYPEAAAKKNENGWYPLHFLCANPSVLRHVSASTVRDARKKHEQQAFHPPNIVLDLFRDLVLAHPPAARKLTKHARQSTVEILCRCWKDLSIQWPPYTMEIIRLLMDAAAPEQLPLLHVACQTRPFDSKFIRQVMSIMPPEAAGTTDEMQRLPLHLAFQSTLPSRLVSPHLEDDEVFILPSRLTLEALIEAYPAACWTGDKWGRFPLHIACRHLPGRSPLWFEDSDVSTLIGDCLLTAHPQAAAQKTKDSREFRRIGAYPLHLACINNKILESSAGCDAICRLVSAFPEAAAALVYERCVGRHENPSFYPLHLLCKNSGTFEGGNGRGVAQAVRAILDAYPSAAKHAGGGDSWYPLHYVCRQKCEKCSDGAEVVRFLLAAFPEAASKTYTHHSHHGYPLHQIWERWNLISRTNCASILCKLLMAFPEAAKAPRRCNESCPANQIMLRSAKTDNLGPGHEIHGVAQTLLTMAPESLFLTCPFGEMEEGNFLDWVLKSWDCSKMDEWIAAAYGRDSSTDRKSAPHRGQFWDEKEHNGSKSETILSGGTQVRPTPLHVACFSMVEDAEVYRKIHQLFPGCAEARDVRGNMPLHVFCQAKWWGGAKDTTCQFAQNACRIASELISWYGQALYIPDSFGEIPFVAACRRSAIRSGEQAQAEQDVLHNLSLSFLFLLLRESPMAVEKR